MDGWMDDHYQIWIRNISHARHKLWILSFLDSLYWNGWLLDKHLYSGNGELCTQSDKP